MMRNKPILATISILFLAFSIYAGVLLLDDRSADTRSLASSTPTLSLTTDEVSYPTHVNFAVTLKANTDNNPVDSIKSLLTYDTTTLKAISITPLQAFTSQTIKSQEINHKLGQIDYQVAPAPGTPPNNVNASIAIIVFQAQKTGTITLGFDASQSSASIKPGNANILENYTPLTLTITP